MPSDSVLAAKADKDLDPIKHVRDFLDCRKSRQQPAANADANRMCSRARRAPWLA